MPEQGKCLVCGEDASVEAFGNGSRFTCLGCGLYMTDDVRETAFLLQSVNRRVVSILLRQVTEGNRTKPTIGNRRIGDISPQHLDPLIRSYVPRPVAEVLSEIVEQMRAEVALPLQGVLLRWHDAQRFGLPDGHALEAALRLLEREDRIVLTDVTPSKAWRAHLAGGS